MRDKYHLNERLKRLGRKLMPREKEKFYNKVRAYYRLLRKLSRASKNKFSEKMSKLEDELKKNLPSLSGAEDIHEDIHGCGFKTAYKLGDNRGGEDIYYCAFCNKYYQPNASDLRYRII